MRRSNSLVILLASIPEIASFTFLHYLQPRRASSRTIVTTTSSGTSLAAQQKFVQWTQSASSQEWQLQTAVTSYQLNDTRLELHAMVHFALSEYFTFYNNHLNGSTVVVYELLVDEQLLETIKDSTRLTRLRESVDASASDLQTAQTYGLTCQASIIDYCRPNFVHGDLTRQELLKTLDQNKNEQPLWQQASGWSAGREAATALLVGPPLLAAARAPTGVFLSSSSSSSSSSPLFRQMVHSRAVQLLRPLLWLTVPSPEVSILLLDWSNHNDVILGSPTSRAVLQSIASGDWDATRKLVFGQVLVTNNGYKNNNNIPEEEWMRRRSQRAMDVVKQVMDDTEDDSTINVLYGCLHCNDLQQRLLDMGFEPVERRWRTAWTVPVPALTATRLLDSNVLKLLFLLVSYLGIGGLDWIATWGDVTHSYAEAARTSTLMSVQAVSNVLGEYALYLFRHLLLYMGLSKFVWSSKQS